ncbi:MAG: cellulase family glycosylhydrolase [Caldilineaceae bacterium]
MSNVILWAGKVSASNGGQPDQVLDQPDGHANTLSADISMTLGDFQGRLYPDLLPLLNGAKGGDVVTAEMLAKTDVIAFELNGGHAASNRGWESSRWLFSDDVTSPVAVDWDERTGTGESGAPALYPTEVIANGSTDSNSYAAFFGIDWPSELGEQVISYILFDLPATIDIRSPNFTITVRGWADGQHGEGTPDPDAIGILTDRLRSRTTFYTEGRNLHDPLGNQVILRGVNKMSVWDGVDPTGVTYFPEIRQTGANSVRIVWSINNAGAPTDPMILDALITNARQNHLIPMIELHDATGEWQRLPELVDYWVRPEIIALIQKHQAYLLVNIGNEVGDDTVTAPQFIAGYTNAVQTLRAAGIHTPLVIDAADWGKNLDLLDASAAPLLTADPEHNLLFSVHLYWSLACGADANYIRSKLDYSAGLGYPLIVGEFSQYGGYPCGHPQGTSMCSPGGEIDYRTILESCHRHEIGWYAWEWGPGNDFTDPLCAVMDMTPDRLFANLKAGWAEEVALASPYSIKNTSVTPPTM